MQPIFRYLPLLLVALATACAEPPRSQPEHTEKFGEWRVLVSGRDSKNMLCYAGSSPAYSEGSIGQRESKPYLMVTRRISGKIEVSTSPGYTYMQGSKVELSVDSDAYDLFYKGMIAWARGDKDDEDIVDTMDDADGIEVRGLSRQNLTSVDHYSSSGFAEALERIRELCP